MKKVFAILAAGGIMTAATVQAQVDIYITGSTAFRANAYNSIIALYGANLTSQNPSPAGSKNMVTFQGTIPGTFGSQTVTIRTSFSGSAAGVQSLTQNNNLNFLSSASNGDTNLVSHQADLAFSDVFQAATTFRTPNLDPGFDDLVGHAGTLPSVRAVDQSGRGDANIRTANHPVRPDRNRRPPPHPPRGRDGGRGFPRCV